MGNPVRTRSALLYGLATALALAELAILALALQPQVSSTYRARYIDGTSDCWEYNVSGEYVLGKRLGAKTADATPELRNLLRCGWFPTEGAGTWSNGSEAKLRFRLEPNRPDLNLELELAPFTADRGVTQPFTVRAGDTVLADLILDQDGPTFRQIRIPANLPLDAENRLELTFDLPGATSGQELGFNDDTRRFGIRLISLRLAPRRKAARHGCRTTAGDTCRLTPRSCPMT